MKYFKNIVWYASFAIVVLCFIIASKYSSPNTITRYIGPVGIIFIVVLNVVFVIRNIILGKIDRTYKNKRSGKIAFVVTGLIVSVIWASMIFIAVDMHRNPQRYPLIENSDSD
jgi:mannose/fructose/N-acetylgalactosamine-specific phosphotransferase system component IIC